jgi:ATP-dependent protease ClpP protease subunit
MNTVEIRGILVDAGYDNWMWENEIANGFITPESRVRKQIAASKGDLHIIINSYGGSVFGANTIAAALAGWRSANPGSKLTMTVEAIALSAAANLLLQAPVDTHIRAHKNSLLMYHGAQNLTFGGEGAHQDTEKALQLTNSEIKSALIAKGINSNQVDGWFAEGRMGWMSAQEAKQYGIVGEIIAAEAKPAAKISAEQAQKFHNRSGLDLAAFAVRPGASLLDVIRAEATETTETTETTVTVETTETEEKEDGTEETTETTVTVETTEETTETTETTETEGNETEGNETKDDATEEEAIQQALAAAEARASAAEARVAALEKQIASLSASQKQLSAKLGKLTAGLKGAGGKLAGPSSFAEAVDLIQREHPRWQRDDCVLAARKQYPELYQALLQQK